MGLPIMTRRGVHRLAVALWAAAGLSYLARVGLFPHRWLDPAGAVYLDFHEDWTRIHGALRLGCLQAPDGPRDPWGRPWCLRVVPDRGDALEAGRYPDDGALRVRLEGRPGLLHCVHSAGPDGRDDAGRGDDLAPGRLSALRLDVLHGLPTCGRYLAMILGFWAAGLHLRRRERLAQEARLVAAMSLPAAWTAAVAVGWIGDRGLGRYLPDLPPTVVIPERLALFGCATLASGLVCAALRLAVWRAAEPPSSVRAVERASTVRAPDELTSGPPSGAACPA